MHGDKKTKKLFEKKEERCDVIKKIEIEKIEINLLFFKVVVVRRLYEKHTQKKNPSACLKKNIIIIIIIIIMRASTRAAPSAAGMDDVDDVDVAVDGGGGGRGEDEGIRFRRRTGKTTQNEKRLESATQRGRRKEEHKRKKERRDSDQMRRERAIDGIPFLERSTKYVFYSLLVLLLALVFPIAMRQLANKMVRLSTPASTDKNKRDFFGALKDY